MPTELLPQLATLARTAPEGDDWLYEVKFDGYRLLAFIEGRRIRLLTRRGHDWTDRFPHVQEALRALPVKQAVLDGEVVAAGAHGASDFQALQASLKQGGPLAYCLFDLIHCDGLDLSHCPLEARKRLLAERLSQAQPPGLLRFSDHVRGRGQEFLDFACRSGQEGIIAKRADSPYRQERTHDWLKVKCLNRQEFVVGGFTDPAGSRTGFGALLLGVYDDSRLLYCGRVGTGFDQSGGCH